MPRTITVQKFSSSPISFDLKKESTDDLMKYEFATTQASTEASVMSYIGYYVASLLFNAFLLAFYAVAVFSSHHDCLTKNGTNITTWFEFMFRSGLVLLGLEIVNSNFCNIYYRFKIQLEERELGLSCKSTHTLHQMSILLEWVFRVGTIVLSLI